MKEECV